mgnify:FL=1
MKTKVYVSCDHAAIDLKDELCAHINEKDGYEAVDLGIKHGEKIDYPVAAKRVADAVLSDKGSLGLLICGTGIGMSIAANKVKGIRAAAVSEPYSAKLTRMHNDANVLCMGARVVGPELAKMILDEYLDAEFEGGRHAGRVELISKIENGRL